MKLILARLAKLERRARFSSSPNYILQRLDETVDEALARFIREHGPPEPTRRFVLLDEDIDDLTWMRIYGNEETANE